MESFNEDVQRGKWAKGFEDCNMFKNLAASPARQVVNGVPETVAQKTLASSDPKMNIEAPWFQRRSK